MIEQLHFVRPWWLLALIPLCFLLLFAWRGRRSAGRWQAVCDTHLLPYIVEQDRSVGKLRSLLVLALAGAVAILALAGPAWQKLPQPLFKQQSALVVMLDLSKSMDAEDISPSRLERARLKLLDLLRLREDGQTALIVYAGDAFVVTPLTDDTETIAALVHTLSTTLMPVQGSRPELAVEQAVDLLSQVGESRGTLLLLSDGVDEDDVHGLSAAVVEAGHRLSVVAVGTPDGAPIPGTGGGFVKDRSGRIVVPKLNESRLRQLALESGGVYSRMSIDDSDIEQVLALADDHLLGADTERTELKTDQWREEGPWLLLLLLPAALLVFRRGLLAAALVVGLHISDPAAALDWSDLWLNPNQQGARAMGRQDYDAAAKAFHDEQWRAAAYYRAGRYDEALATLQHATGADAAYNRGNAMAKLGRIPDAVESYEQALLEDPHHRDAKYNLDLLRKLQQDQPQSDSSHQQQESSPSEQEQKSGDQKQQQEAQSNQANTGEGDDDQRRQGQSGQANSGEGAADQQDRTQNMNRKADPELPSEPEGQDEAMQTKENQLPQGELPQSDEDGGEAQGPTEADQEPPTEEQQAMEQWLRRVPDDPGGLLRRKFHYQYSRRSQPAAPEAQQW